MSKTRKRKLFLSFETLLARTADGTVTVDDLTDGLYCLSDPEWSVTSVLDGESGRLDRLFRDEPHKREVLRLVFDAVRAASPDGRYVRAAYSGERFNMSHVRGLLDRAGLPTETQRFDYDEFDGVTVQRYLDFVGAPVDAVY
ncbi:hypothetical protein ACFL26_01910 [Patescibacteria group bacterium]